MHIGDKRNRQRIVDYVQGIRVHVQGIRVQANQYWYSAKYSTRWKSGVDSESSEVYGYQKFGPGIYIPKGTVKHDHCNVILIHTVDSNVAVCRLEVSDSAQRVNGNYNNSDRMPCSMGSQWHTVLAVPQSVDIYRVLKFRVVAKRIVSSKLQMANCYCPEQTYLQNRYFTYGNDTPIPINNVYGSVWGCSIHFLGCPTCLLNRFKHEVGVRECEEGQRNENDEDASEKDDKPMPVMAAQVVNPMNIQSIELTHLMPTPETMV